MRKKFVRQNADWMRGSLSILGALVLMLELVSCDSSNRKARGQAAVEAHAKAALIVAQIQRADYEGNQAGMQKGYEELAPFLANKKLASRVRYWRGFAIWRKAVNGFNDSVDPKELEQDLRVALGEFKAATAIDPEFVDAKIATISCLGYLAFMHRTDKARTELSSQMLLLVKGIREAAQDNPRFLWVLGPILWNRPADRGGGQDKAIENYERGLALFEKNKGTSADPLEPSWGKPELMMNLAYSHLNKHAPDINAAENYARSALQLVPYWHYVRDILLPQILEAKAKVM